MRKIFAYIRAAVVVVVVFVVLFSLVGVGVFFTAPTWRSIYSETLSITARL